ncbi:MAG: hypothetical protein OXU24_03950 [Gammaproteobacteria bacterium]|nr:hypothetical protein [Gammaproteobacteria bacterium]
MGSDLIETGTNDMATVVINESAVSSLDLDSAEAAIGHIFYSNEENTQMQAFQVAGVVQDSNLLGLANDIKASVFRLEPAGFSSLSVRIDPAARATALADINRVWREFFIEIPPQIAFLEDTFRSRYQIFAGINQVLIGLSVVSILLAVFGLYGLVSVLAQQRRHEIAVRKVLGASVANLLRLLSWQFTKPVSIALLISAPLGILAGGQYLNLFAERIGWVSWIALSVCVGILVLAWFTVSGQIVRVASSSPSHDLHCE